MKRRLALVVLGLSIGLMASCRHRTPTPDHPQIVKRDGYAYARYSPTEVFLVAADEQNLRLALMEIGCGKAFVCQIERNGTEFLVTQTRK